MTFFLALWLVTFVVLFTAYFLISQVVEAIQQHRLQRRWNAKHEELVRERQERVEAWQWPSRIEREERTGA